MVDKRDTKIGGAEFDIKDSRMTIGNVDASVTAGGHIVGGDYTEIHHHGEGPRKPVPPLPYEPETVIIPAGTFVMGSDDGEPYEGPRHEVNLPAYRIGKFPLTNRQYAEFIKRILDIEPPKRAGWDQRRPPQDRLDYPVTGVSWYEAQAYCRWLTEQTEGTRIYRLPTEAEWEKAARGVDGWLYSWGNEWNAERCNVEGKGIMPVVADESPRFTTGISPFGCIDMLGNVQEWTSSPWGNEIFENEFGYPFSLADHREQDADGRVHVFRVHRGRSFRDKVSMINCPNRGFASPDSKVSWRGIRVLLEISTEEH